MSQKAVTFATFQRTKTWDHPAAEADDCWPLAGTIGFVIAFNGLAWLGIVAAVKALF